MVTEAEEFDPSIVADADDAALMAAISKRDAEVQPLIKSHPIKALQLALADPPYATNTVAVKEASFDVVCKPIMTIKEADIEVRSRTQVCLVVRCGLLLWPVRCGCPPDSPPERTQSTPLGRRRWAHSLWMSAMYS